MKHTLLLASSSKVRQLLLEQIQIPFTIVTQNADESLIPHTTLEETVSAIARLKMEHIVLPPAHKDAVAFIITADSMGASSDGMLHGKPKDRNDAINKLHALTGKDCRTATGFCLEKRIFKNNQWHTEQAHTQVVTAHYEFNVPKHWIDRYLQHSWGMQASGAIAIEFYGMQFLKSVSGSFSAIMGLPLYEVREALETFGFFEQ